MIDEDQKHLDNLKRFEEIKTIFANHEEVDIKFQERMIAQFERMEPMVKAFENRQIEHMVYDKQRKTLYVYAKEITVVGTAIAVIGAFIKYLFLRQ